MRNAIWNISKILTIGTGFECFSWIELKPYGNVCISLKQIHFIALAFISCSYKKKELKRVENKIDDKYEMEV